MKTALVKTEGQIYRIRYSVALNLLCYGVEPVAWLLAPNDIYNSLIH